MQYRTNLSRRDLLVGAAGTLAAAAPGLRRAGAQPVEPNIVFILADDLGFADVSCYGQSDYTTPNVDRLALEGMKFTQAYANSSAQLAGCRTTLRIREFAGGREEALHHGAQRPVFQRGDHDRPWLS